jgi:hypothetical protein
VDRLNEWLKMNAMQYDAVGIVVNFLESGGINGLEDVWRHCHDTRRWLADRLMEMARVHSLEDRGAKTLIHMIGSSDREQVLAQICAALGGWGIVYGHTHEPQVIKRQVTDPLTGEERTVLLGNCGSFRRKSVPPTWIETRFPCMELWAYDAECDEANLLDYVQLTAEEAECFPVPAGAEATDAFPVTCANG